MYLMTISIFPDTHQLHYLCDTRYPLSATNSIVIIAGPWSQNLETLIVFEHNHRVIVKPVINILSRIRSRLQLTCRLPRLIYADKFDMLQGNYTGNGLIALLIINSYRCRILTKVFRHLWSRKEAGSQLSECYQIWVVYRAIVVWLRRWGFGCVLC